jgi:NADPH:quinone reductase-like Zn-dependent oxidoreductase
VKAAVCTRYGPPDVLEVREVRKPVPGDRDVLVKVGAAAVTPSDCFIRSGIPSAPIFTRFLFRLVVGVSKPRQPILGMVVAGEVAQIGKTVTRFQRGDRVFAFTKFRFGAYAQYAAVAETGILTGVPATLTDAQAAAIPYGGLLALHCLKKGRVGRGERVLIYGASGAVGTAAVQLAKYFGADVTAVCGPSNLELVQSLGADVAIDYTTQDAPNPGIEYDVIFDAAGKRKTSPFKAACHEALRAGGVCVSVDDGRPQMAPSDIALLARLAAAGALTPVIDRCYSLAQIGAAHEYVERGHKKGNVIVNVSHESAA